MTAKRDALQRLLVDVLYFLRGTKAKRDPRKNTHIQEAHGGRAHEFLLSPTKLRHSGGAAYQACSKYDQTIADRSRKKEKQRLANLVRRKRLQLKRSRLQIRTKIEIDAQWS